MYVFDDSVNSILKAGFLYAHTGEFPIYEIEQTSSLFRGPARHVQEVSWGEIYNLDPKYKHKKREITNNQILHMIFYNLRHNEASRFQLVVSGVKELLNISPKIWLTGKTAVGHKMLRQKNDVAREIHKMVGYIRFVPVQDDFLVGTAPLEHQTADLILIKFRKRYPQHKLGIVIGNEICVLHPDDSITLEPADSYHRMINDDKFKDIWRKYYSSQYIKERKNIKYVQRSIPKKYWKWIDEGSIIAEEGGVN